MKELRKAMPVLVVLIYFMIGMILILMPSMVSAELSDDTLEEVDKLRFKHYPFISIDDCKYYDSHIQHEWWSVTFEDGKLFINTQDGKWFIEMKKIKE